MHPSLTMRDRLAAGEFVLSAELTPPRHYQLDDFLRRAALAAPHVDVLQLNDNLLSQARCSTLACAARLAERGWEPVVQFGLRHKNRIALQSDLLGLAAYGVRNLIVLGGYPCQIGTDPEARDATDLTSEEAVAKISALTLRGELFNGDPIRPAPDFHVGAIDFPCSEEKLEASMARLSAKIAGGVDFIQVQAVFELGPLARWMEEVVARGLHRRAKFLAAIFPFSGAERLAFLQTIPGLVVPPELVARVRGRDGEAESLAISLDLVRGILEMEGFSGLHLRSIGAEGWVGRILEGAGLAPGGARPAPAARASAR